MTEHEHRYTFLRQEERNVKYDRAPEWLIEDVFFCEGCLDYQRVEVRREVPDTRSFGRVVLSRAQ